MLLFLSLFIEHPYSAFLLSPLSSSLSSRSGCNLYGKPQTTPQLPKRHQTKRIHSKGKWKSRLSIEYCKCKLSVCTKGQWVGCGRKEVREDREWWDLLWVIFILFLLDIGKSLKKKKNSEQVKNRWMSLVNMQRNKVKKLQILCYFVTVSLVFKYVYFYSYTINSYSIVPWVIFTVTIYFYSFKSICYFLLHHSLKSLICTVIRRF